MNMDIKHLSFDNRDEFNRRNTADKVIKLLDSGIDVSPMVIDGSWGTGKTEFCHKLFNLLSSRDTHQQIYIDAFRADHADEPLMTILAEVIKILPTGEAQSSFIEKALPALRYGLKTIAKAGVAHLLRQDYLDVVDDFDKELQETAEKTINATVESLLKEHVQAENNLKSLQNVLQEIAAIKPIVIFVDELDRCRPNFAIELLEIIKHTFDVPNVRFVLITNKKQLKAAINHCYGASVDAHRYLDKFVKFTISLPEVTAKDTHNESLASIAHYKNLVQASNVLNDLKLSECHTIRIVETVIKANSLSLREVETFVRHIEIYVTLSEGAHSVLCEHRFWSI
jgi:predicted KAP-like P-loop ATPase